MTVGRELSGLLLLAVAGSSAAQPTGSAPRLEGARVLHREEAAARVEARGWREAADALAARLSSSRAAESGLLGELSALDGELSVASRRARAAALELKAASLAAVRAQDAAAALDERLAATRRRVGLVLTALHLEGERPEWRRLVEGGDRPASDFAVGAALRHAELGRELEAAGHAARLAEEAARASLEALELARALEQDSLTLLRRRRASRESRLGSLRRETDRLDSELEQARAALQAVLSGALPEAPSAPIPADPAPARSVAFDDLSARRGLLPWPLARSDRGRLVERFGEVVDPVHGTRTLRHGMVLEAPGGAPIRAVAAGRVVFRDWYKGFGQALVVDHGNGFLSVVAHCRELFVGVGDPVDEGQVVGTVGESGSLHGPRLYFQLQRAGEPVNPLDWLRD